MYNMLQRGDSLQKSDNEKILLKKARNGDIEAFELLIEDYQKKAFNVAYRMMGNSEDANDLVQEALIRIFKSIKNFKEQSSFSTWVYRIVTNVCLDELRRRKNKFTISIDEDIQLEDGNVKRQIESEGPTPEESLESKEIQDIVTKAIEELSNEHKTVIVLRDIQGFSYDEISDIMKCPEGTVKSRINRARKALREILKKQKELLSGYYVK
jgi:RNA polymerase sigma-70 factor (ECF subfamily)